MKAKRMIELVFYLAFATSVTAQSVTPPSEELVKAFNLAPFYKKHLLVNGLPIVGGEKVADYALHEAAYLMRNMLANRPEILPVMAQNKVRFSIMACSEFTTDIPEHSDLTPKDYFDRRARGLGATSLRPAVSCGEENLLCFPGDPYGTENILIHELGHAIHEMGMKEIDPAFDRRLRKAYDAAMKDGLWKTKYASQNHHEYWAEGVQSWFDTNRINDHDHNHVHTRSQIREYDPRLAKLLEEVFGDLPWRYQKPSDRPAAGKAHLVGFDAAKSPLFRWPERLLAVDLQKRIPPAASSAQPLILLAAEQEIPPSGRNTEISIIYFENNTDQELELFWIDFNKARKSYGRIGPGQSCSMNTFVGHSFELCNAQGKRVAAVVADKKPGKAIIK